MLLTYTYKVMTHLNSRLLDLCLLQEDYTIVIIWEETGAGQRTEKQEGEAEKGLYALKTVAWKITI